ncbi:DUF1883 domain-containing protein [Budvicia aquatica]|uniref:DUF1883 domain-containing protein n=1 Tax=Budvicia aquatica TaxID=82979 RepID=A0A2C6DQG2_9GAMM|nr:DUF1883 domain-containing protein [Budvicia aquatica]PHI31051.1 DUF1883 domain-containing protein [Budvicia aquatica]VFS51247.1 Domain of uncharacterised function (DUF1883) [Budvicia aquatica]
MNHLHKRFNLNAGDTVKVDCSHQCNVLLLTDTNYRIYSQGGRFTHHGGGGFFKRLPALLTVPHSGGWNVVLDLGGGSANIRHSITIIPS